MIAIKALKYKIFDYCLDILIDRLASNFKISKATQGHQIRVEDVYVGMHLSEIKLHLKLDELTIIFGGCTIISVDSFGGDSKDDPAFYCVTFMCETEDGQAPRSNPQSWNTDSGKGSTELMEFYV